MPAFETHGSIDNLIFLFNIIHFLAPGQPSTIYNLLHLKVVFLQTIPE